MLFQQYYLDCLAHASYMIASGGIAAVVDPQRDVDLYIEDAQRLGLRIAYVIETHLHADFVSGHRELADRTGAEIYIGARADATFPHHAVRDGETLAFGDVRVQFLETPGHTVEGISIVVTDVEKSKSPQLVLTGDTLFIGDVGRPDLSRGRTPAELAGMMYDSLHQKLLTLPDDVEVYPAHGAGSLCGRAMSDARSSTIGEQRRTNAALQYSDRDSFIAALTTDLPERPAYFPRDAEINRAGAPAVAPRGGFVRLSPRAVERAREGGALVLDVRDAESFGRGHVPGSVNIGLSGQFASWAGSVVGLDVDVIIVADDDERTEEARLRLSRVGIERVLGVLDGGIAAWERAGARTQSTAQLQPAELAAEIASSGIAQIVDVRRAGEWDEGHLPNAVHRPLDVLAASLGGLDPALPTAVYCAGGYRSSIGASVLQNHGFGDVRNLVGGYTAWHAAGLATVAPATAVAR